MNTRKLMTIAVLALMGASFENDLQAGPRQRRIDTLATTTIAIAPPPAVLPRSAPPSSTLGVVIIHATGERLTQPKVLLYPTLTKLQRIGDLIEHGKDPVR